MKAQTILDQHIAVKFKTAKAAVNGTKAKDRWRKSERGKYRRMLRAIENSAKLPENKQNSRISSILQRRCKSLGMRREGSLADNLLERLRRASFDDKDELRRLAIVAAKETEHRCTFIDSRCAVCNAKLKI